MDATTVKAKIKEMLCERLGIEADVLDYDTPLFNEGHRADSIDSLEIISAIDEEYGVPMTGVGKSTSKYRRAGSLRRSTRGAVRPWRTDRFGA